MSVEAGILDQVTQQFMTAFHHDATLIQRSAHGLFYSLTLIQFMIATLWMVLSGEDLQRMFVRYVQFVGMSGFFYACLDYGGQWMTAIINGFIQLGQQTGVTSIDPSSVLDQGLSIAGIIMHAFFGTGMLMHPFVSLIGAVVCIAIVIIYGLLVAELAIILVKSYFLVSVASLFFAFAGSDITRTMTVNYFRTVIGLGLQLMTMYFLIGVGQSIGSDWASITATAAQQHQLVPMLAMLAGVIVYYMIVKNVPPFIAGLSGVGGFRNYGESAVATAIGAGIDGAGHLAAAGKMMGGAAQSAGQLANVGMQTWQAGSAAKMAGGAGTLGAIKTAANGLAKSTAKAAKDTVMRKNTRMTAGQKLNHHLSNHVRGVRGGKL